LRGTPHHFLVAGSVDLLLDVWLVDSWRWRGLVSRAFSQHVLAADDIVSVCATVRFAIDFSAVVGQQPASACLKISIPQIGLHAQFGRTYPALLVVTALVLSGIFLFLAAICE
jgi:hypothetical protein